MPLDPATISILLKVGVPLLLADFALKGYGKIKGIGLEEKQMELLQKQLQAKTKMGRMESERYDKLVKQLLGFREKETGRIRERELLQTLEAGRTRQTGLLMAMLQSLSSQAPSGFRTYGGPSSSMVSLLR